MKWLNHDEKKEIIKGDYNYFIDYLKNESLATRYICNSTYGKAVILIKKLVKCFRLKGLNIDDLYKLIKENASFVLERTSEWKTSEMLLINDTTKEINISCSSAEFRNVNKWGIISEPDTHEIIYDNERIYWIRRKEKEPLNYILSKEKMYGIKYIHKIISIFNYSGNILHNGIVNTDTGLDEIIAKEETPVKHSEINLESHFYKGFFYKGPLWDRNWIEKITIMKNLKFVEGRLRIEIKNITYPHCGYVFLDLESGKVLDE
jgi:hypothetical protein